MIMNEYTYLLISGLVFSVVGIIDLMIRFSSGSSNGMPISTILCNRYSFLYVFSYFIIATFTAFIAKVKNINLVGDGSDTQSDVLVLNSIIIGLVALAVLKSVYFKVGDKNIGIATVFDQLIILLRGKIGLNRADEIILGAGEIFTGIDPNKAKVNLIPFCLSATSGDSNETQAEFDTTIKKVFAKNDLSQKALLGTFGNIMIQKFGVKLLKEGILFLGEDIKVDDSLPSQSELNERLGIILKDKLNTETLNTTQGDK